MRWNAEELQNKINELEIRIQSVSSFEQRTLLLQDLNNLKHMLSYLKSLTNEGPMTELSAMKILNKEEYLDTADALSEVGPQIAHKFISYSNLHNVRSRIVFQKRIDQSIMKDIISEFLLSFDPNLYELFKKYERDQRILLSNKPFETSTCCGKCFPIANEGSSYICSTFNKRLTNGITLVHELGHAYEFEGINDIYQIQRLVYNVFGEAYAIFVELAFIEYLKNTKYRSMAFDEQANRLNNFLAYTEYYLTSLYNLKKVDPVSNQAHYSEYFSKKKIIDAMLSSMLAMYWQSIYIKNPQQARVETLEYIEKSRVQSFRELVTGYPIDNLYDGLSDILNSYYQNYRKR